MEEILKKWWNFKKTYDIKKHLTSLKKKNFDEISNNSTKLEKDLTKFKRTKSNFLKNLMKL